MVVVVQVMYDSCNPWTVAHQAPLFMGFPRQEDWSGLPFPSPRDLPDPGIEPTSSAWAGGFFAPEPPGMAVLSWRKGTYFPSLFGTKCYSGSQGNGETGIDNTLTQ